MNDFEHLIQRGGESKNPSIKFEELLRFFEDGPIEFDPEMLCCKFSWLATPWDAYIRQKQCALQGIDLSTGQETDVFLWETRKKVNVRSTYIGGRPHYPSKQIKKSIEERLPPKEFEFIAQINFGDSKDLMKTDLPAEILQVYVARGHENLFDLEGRLQAVWIDHANDDLNWVKGKCRPVYGDVYQGVRCRLVESWDEADRVLGNAQGRGFELPLVLGTKIGGSPWDSQEFHEPEHPSDAVFLCQIGSFWHYGNTATFYDSVPKGSNFMIGDGGGICLYLHQSGDVVFSGSCT